MNFHLENKIRKFTLTNGLRVVHKFEPSTAMVAVDVLYDTGSRDENSTLTGIAHLFEHLMFGGSENVHDFDGILQDAGGTSNAWTSNDFTNFYDVLPAQNIETAFYLESDRMLALDFSSKSLEIQRDVVIEEFKQRVLNQPYGTVMHDVRGALYGSHPYSWPTIGKEISHIENINLDHIRTWFYSHYAPNNAILSVVGNVTFEKVSELAHKWFGPLPKREISLRPEFPFDFSKIVEFKEVRSDIPQPMIVIAFPMPKYGSIDYYACDAITDLLAAGKASRFYQRLIAGEKGRGLFAQADASIIGSEDTGMLLLTAIVMDKSPQIIRQCVSILLDELKELADFEECPSSKRELMRVSNRYETQYRLQSLSLTSVAFELAADEYHHEQPNDKINKYKSLTPAIIQAQASALLSSPRSIVIYLPNSSQNQ